MFHEEWKNLKSQPNVGSIFTCVIPFKAALHDNEQDALVTAPSTHQLDSALKKSKIEKYISILLVEDDVIAAKVMTGLPMKLGCRVKHAQNGKQAIQAANSDTYDLIFVDIGLLDINGIEVTKQIRQCSKNGQTPIIALTAHLDPDQEDNCLKSGMNAFFRNPYQKK